MYRKLITILATLLVISLTASTAFAGNVHFSGSVDFSLKSLVASGTLAGLGNADVNVILQGSGIGTATCTNKGGNSAPGQNPVQVNVQGVESIPATLFDNGTTPFQVETAEPVPPTAKEAGCPNNNWQVTSFVVSWTSASIIVEDAASGAILLRQDYTCTTTSTSVTCTPTP